MNFDFIAKNKKIIAISVIVVIVAVVFFGWRKPGSRQERANLIMWGIFDDSATWQKLIGKFEEQNPNIKISYLKKDFDSYDSDLVDSMAAGDGPDIFIIPNNWVLKYSDKIQPAPTGWIGLKNYQDAFVDAAFTDFVAPNGNVFGIPLYLDSLVLYWNKDIFARAGLSSPPKTWSEFTQDVQILTKKDKNGDIIQSGAAIGTAKNVNRACDILTLLALQKKFKIIDLSQGNTDLTPNNFQNILDFYTSFANPNGQNYTWNSLQHYSIDDFAEGKVAMMFNYNYLAPTLRAKEPYLNFGVSNFPQFSQSKKEVYLAHYRGLVVSKHCAHPSAAWKFLIWMAGKKPSLEYAKLTQQVPARRDLISQFSQRTDLGVVAQESISAASWAKIQPKKIEDLINQAIDSVAIDRQDSGMVSIKFIHSLNLIIKDFKISNWFKRQSK